MLHVATLQPVESLSKLPPARTRIRTGRLWRDINTVYSEARQDEWVKALRLWRPVLEIHTAGIGQPSIFDAHGEFASDVYARIYIPWQDDTQKQPPYSQGVSTLNARTF